MLELKDLCVRVFVVHPLGVNAVKIILIKSERLMLVTETWTVNKKMEQLTPEHLSLHC